MKSIKFKKDILENIFNKTQISWYDNDEFYIALHTKDPGVSGSQSTNEAVYENYSRQKILRNSDYWTISDGQVSNKKILEFPVCIGGKKVKVSHISIGLESKGDGQIIYSGVLAEDLEISINIKPEFGKNTIIILEN